MGGAVVRVWAAVQGSFWLIPVVMASVLSGLALLLTQVDAGRPSAADALFVTLGVEGARTVLSTIAGGMMTVASIVISLTFVALTTMSSQLGPRILVFFMRDRPTQIVLGAFTGTFLFALIALSATGGPDDHVPAAAVLAAIGFAVISFGLMAFYVHHAAESLQADILVSRLAAQLLTAIDDLASVRRGDRIVASDDLPGPEPDSCTLGAPGAGYVEFIDRDGLLAIARESGGRIDILARPASFLLKGVALVRLSAEAMERQKAVRACITLSPTRTPMQQAHFEFSAITEIAVRALSPGVNDPYTAAACVDRLFEGLAKAAQRGVTGDIVHREDGRILLTERRHSFGDYLDTAFAPIRKYGRDDALVAGRIAAGYEMLAAMITNEDERAMLCSAARNFRNELDEHMSSARDRETLLEQLDRMIDALEGPASPLPVLGEEPSEDA